MNQKYYESLNLPQLPPIDPEILKKVNDVITFNIQGCGENASLFLEYYEKYPNVQRYRDLLKTIAGLIDGTSWRVPSIGM